ncbi:MAG TPA: NAD(P)/FAD-dependent oxidoreductase [Candidatus Methanoperedens sp.]|nr:NAD(P)/FAD-dependent oxidoreductase [Candidatus Methanoperedens sp.]HLB71308.1 NAD(P)/FAD-dependent oxidoreductase [Candidatus Methanoperedens sp.]
MNELGEIPPRNGGRKVTGKSIIIIGAGLAGLSTGCYAQMNGYNTQIFEHHTKPGGVATCWKRKDYVIDGGIHFLICHRQGQSIYELYRELGTAQPNRFLDMTTYLRYIDETSMRSILITQNLDSLTKELKAFSPTDARTIDDFMVGARALQGSDMGEMGLSKPPELMGFMDKLGLMWKMRRVFKYFTGKYAKSVADYGRTFHDPRLRLLIENLFLPEVPVWFIFMLLGLLADGHMGLLEGGSLNFVLPVEKRYEDLGGKVTYNATVEKILVENDRAVGVRLADGSEHRADIIVSAADGYSTIFNMLEGRYVDKEIEERYRNWKLFRPLVMVSFGVAREFTGEPCLNIIKLERSFMVGNKPIEWITIRIFNYSSKFAPVGKTVIQAMFETEWDWWKELQKDRPTYEAEKERVMTEVLERLEAHYPSISSQVEMTDVATPYTWWRYTRNHRGAFEGWLPTPEVINTQVKKTLPGLANFYMAGQWVMPGGGVPPCLYSGRHIVQILCHRDEKPFSISFP